MKVTTCAEVLSAVLLGKVQGNPSPTPADNSNSIGSWTSWAEWSACSHTCGDEGTKTRMRACLSLSTPNAICPHGHASQAMTCPGIACPSNDVDGAWSAWGSWTGCDKTCGSGSRNYRYRSCDSPAPQGNGKACSTNPYGESDFKLCFLDGCPVNGGYTEWSEWSPCGHTCGGFGTTTSYRECTNPAPANNGSDCTGEATRSKTCNEQPCAIHGSWGMWGNWAPCTLSCGSGTRWSGRFCDSPAPSPDGDACQGQSMKTEACNQQACPVHGGYSAWSNWSACSHTCGGGTQNQQRTCTDPAPANGGDNCITLGNATNTQDCNTQTCPIDGGFSDWSNWGSCSTTCGEGTKTRSRSCTNPAPQHGGADCTGDLTNSESCNVQSCAGVTATCNEDNTVTATVKSDVSGSILSIAYGSCTNASEIDGAEGDDQTEWTLTFEPFRCDMEGKLRTLKYNQTAEIIVGRKSGSHELVFNTYNVDTYCEYQAEYTVSFVYGSLSTNDYEFTDAGGVLGLNFYIESMNEHFNETAVSSTQAGEKIYLSLKLNSTANPNFDYADNADAGSGKIFVPKSCFVKDTNNNNYTLFDTDETKCTNDFIDFEISAKNFGRDGAQAWNFSHTLFLLDNQDTSEYTLECTVIVCDASRASDCGNAGNCLVSGYYSS